ncbi:MAG: DUF971 domain-containing protein [Planctomycetota bacterium]
MAHQPIQFGDHKDSDDFGEVVEPLPPGLKPTALDLKKDTALTITWSDGRISVYPVGYLRRHSPSAEAKSFREKQAENPLMVLPASASNASGKPFQAENAELIGNYALRIEFSDGHRTGLYTWAYLREIDPNQQDSRDDHPEQRPHDSST